jgi:hypothetical protein
MSALSIFPYKGHSGKVVRHYYHTWHLLENEERLQQKATAANSNWRHFTPQLPRGPIHGMADGVEEISLNEFWGRTMRTTACFSRHIIILISTSPVFVKIFLSKCDY